MNTSVTGPTPEEDETRPGSESAGHPGPTMRRRIMRAILVPVVATGLVLGLPLGVTTWQLVEASHRDSMEVRVQQVVAEVDQQALADGTLDVARLRLAIPPGGRLQLDVPAAGMDRALGAERVAHPMTVSAPLAGGGTATLRVPTQRQRRMQWELAGLVMLAGVLSVVVGATVARATSRTLSAPTFRLAERAARLGAGDFRQDGGRPGIRELDRISEVLDASAAGLAELIKRERQLVADVSHQLRSRLTALHLRLETLLADGQTHGGQTHGGQTQDGQRGSSAPSDSEQIAAALQQCERMSGVLDELLETARQARAADASPLPLTSELQRVVGEWAPAFQSAGRAVQLDAQGSLQVLITAPRLREAVAILLDNALQHGAGEVLVTTRRSSGMATVSVSDEGEGIPESAAPHIFERGVSVEGSTGVGLALARALVEADGGRLRLGRRAPPRFTMYLPMPEAG